ncbi:hypothetical protein [Parapedobacter tibetensis]|uniref:hypothetical protein n=1 Tax=Parapedobacter tibetensis TaxID=2972951 RepID=UPI00214D978A|nr:hypothetical protein [Parapedobacter tibetensis]
MDFIVDMDWKCSWHILRDFMLSNLGNVFIKSVLHGGEEELAINYSTLFRYIKQGREVLV